MRKVASKKAVIDDHFGNTDSTHGHILLMFLFDATDSMTSSMTSARGAVQKMAKLFLKEFPITGQCWTATDKKFGVELNDDKVKEALKDKHSDFVMLDKSEINFNTTDLRPDHIVYIGDRIYMPVSPLRVGTVLYRDPLEGGTESNHEFLKVTDEREFSEFMNNARASGGGDNAEDVAGGLCLLNDMLEEETNLHQTLIVIHVTDAGAHGYPSVGASSDHHNNDEQRARLDGEMKRLVERASKFPDFEYHFYNVRNGTDARMLANIMRDQMRDQMSGTTSTTTKKEKDKDFFKMFTPGSDFEEAMANSTFSSVTGKSVMSVDPLLATYGPKPPDDPIKDFTGYGFDFRLEADGNTCKIYPCGDEGLEKKKVAILNACVAMPFMPSDSSFLTQIKEYSQAVHTFHQFSQRSYRFSNWVSGPRTKTLDAPLTMISHPLLVMSPNPYGKGSEHVVFHGHLLSLSKDDADHIKGLTRSSFKLESEQWGRRTEVVLKFKFGTPNPQGKMHTFAVVNYLMNIFNNINQNAGLDFTPIQLMSPFMLEMDPRTSVMASEKPAFVSSRKTKTFEYSIMGEASLHKYRTPFVKWLNNDGAHAWQLHPDMNEKYRNLHSVIHAFIIFCWKMTGFTFVPSDFQGKLVDRDEFRRHEENQATTFLFTDIACSTENMLAFDDSVNLGEMGIMNIVTKSYKIFKEAVPHMFYKLMKAMEGNVADLDKLVENYRNALADKIEPAPKPGFKRGREGLRSSK